MRSLSVCLYLAATTSLVRADDSLLSIDADPPSAAPVARPAFELGVYTGAFLPSADHQFYNFPLFPGQPGGDPALPVREELKTVSPLVGLRFMYFIASWFGIEAELTMIATATKDSDQAAKIYGGRLGLVFQAANFSKKVVPFIGIGDGFDRVVSPDTVLGNDTDWSPHVTAGLRFLVHRSITVRFDARYLRAPSMQAPYHVNTSVGELMFGVSFRPSSGRAEGTPTASTADTDRDGVLDANDKCPAAAEDKDLFDDADGCPELDNDTDGVSDANDKCPLEAEDKDGFEDEDGCVDKDNDADGIADAQDKCPNEPEDRDAFKDADGCPDPDNDGDGFADGKDTCPNEAEVINGVADDDGCADKGDSFVVVSPDRLELLESITFKKGVLQKSSDNVLGQIGATLRAHQSILRLRITVHVQPTKNPATDRQLTEKRAFAIREWLIKYGIDEKRLDPRGFGGETPLIDPKNKNAAAINDRVELIILERQ